MEFKKAIQELKGYIRNYAEEMLTKSKSKNQSQFLEIICTTRNDYARQTVTLSQTNCDTIPDKL